MLTIPWFVVSTAQQLLRLRPPSIETLLQQQEQLQNQQQQSVQQQSVQQQSVQQQQQPQDQQRQNQQQQRVHQQKQQQDQQIQQQKIPTLQQQQQQPPKKIPVLQQQQQQSQVQNEVSKSNVARVQSSTPANNPAPAVSSDIIQVTSVASQHTVPATRQVEKSTNSLNAEPATRIKPQTSITDPSLQKSSRTLVLAPSASGGRMSTEWAQQQVEKFKFDFDQADKDKSGTLSFKEVYDVLHNVGFKGTQEEAKFIFGHFDRDKDQKITKEEFTAALKNLPRLAIKEFVLRKAFLQLDKDGSGYLSRSEIEDATKSEAGLDIPSEKISALLIYLVKEDKDGKVSYEEFLRVFGVESAATVMKQVFSKLDSDGSGYLTKEEILAAVKAEFELKLKAEKISDLLCYWCKDADKKISYQEFVDVWLQNKGEKPTK